MIRPLLTTVVLVTVSVILATAMAKDDELKTGDTAPAFELIDQNGKVRRLADYRGRWLVLYFYPKDNTPGCTKEACQFRDDYLKLDKLGADVLGISIDNRESHNRFAQQFHLPFPLLADTDGKVASRYGSYFSFGPLRFAKRHSFIIDPESRIAKIYRSVDPKSHSDTVMHDIAALEQASDKPASPY